MEDEIAAWLLEQAEADLKAASPKIIRERWRVDAEPWDAGAGIVNDRGRSVAVAVGGYAARHIAAHHPLTEVARAGSVIVILDTLTAAIERQERERADFRAWMAEGSPEARPVFSDPDPGLIPGLRRAVRLLAWGYRHREGWKEEWKP